MKTDRLIGILSVLLQKEKCTAPELAERFEVSRRTINRDIEALCRAGIPICTMQGASGGIRIMDGYRMDRTLLTSRDMQMILAGLRSLDSVSGSSYYRQLMEKLQVGGADFVSGRDSVLIDLSSWYKESLAPKITLVQDAIAERKRITFHYYAPGGESVRQVEPYYLVFKWSSWYVWGWCLTRKDFRLFKLNRLEHLKMLEEGFAPRQVPMPDLSNERIFPANIRVKVIFDPDAKWRLVEEFGPRCFEEQEDGRLLFQMDYTDEESLLSWLLTFGAKAEVLEPETIKEKLLRTAEGMMYIYRKGGKLMAQKELALYVAEQLEPLGDIRYIPMMGGWLFYYREKLIGGIYEDGFAVKDTPASRRFMPDCRDEVWENTPAALLPCTILEDSGKLCQMVKEMYPELPAPKAKKPGKRRRKADGI